MQPSLHRDIPNTHNTLLTPAGVKASSGEQTQARLRVYDEIKIMSFQNAISVHKFRPEIQTHSLPCEYSRLQRKLDLCVCIDLS